LVLYHRGHRGTQGNPQAIRLRHQSQFSVSRARRRGNAAFSLPRLQRFFQLDATRRFQQYDIAFSSLARQPLASFFWRRDEFPLHSRFASRFHHRLRQAPHAEQEVKFTSGLTYCRISCRISRNVAPALAMQLLASGAEFQHLPGDNNPASRRHRCKSRRPRGHAVLR